MIPFYGADDPATFAIERAAMDRPGRVIEALDRLLPAGRVVDVGAGDGFTADRVRREDRWVVPVEPATGMTRPGRVLPWVRALAQDLPFAGAAFDAAFSTWAYFFPASLDIGPGLDEFHRVVRRGGRLIVVDNAGDDEFTAMAARPIAADLGFWRRAGFECEIVETVFSFDSMADASRLLRLYFGGGTVPKLEVEFRVAILVGESRGPG